MTRKIEGNCSTAAKVNNGLIRVEFFSVETLRDLKKITIDLYFLNRDAPTFAWDMPPKSIHYFSWEFK